MAKVIFEKKNILVIGGAGFIGSHLCDELVKNNKVICLDNFSTGDEKNIDHLLAEPDFEFIRHDITEPIDLEKFPELEKFEIKFQGVQEVYNLACPTSPAGFNANKIASLFANSHGTKNALDIALRYSSKFMHFSSSVVYGERRSNSKISEDDKGSVDMLSPRAVYDEGKRFAETMVAAYREVYGLDTKIARIFRVYGPRMKANDGYMIPDFVNSALAGDDLVINGDENFSSSFCYVGDIIDGILKFMESSESGPINFGSDVDVLIKNIAEKIINIVNAEKKSNITYKDRLMFMSELCLPDISLAREKLNWIPVVTLDAGLKMTVEELRSKRGFKSFLS